MESSATIQLLETALEMERAARYAAERKLLEKQKELNALISNEKNISSFPSNFFNPPLLDTITSHLQTGILVENETGLIVTANTTFCNIFEINIPLANMIGNDIFQKKLFSPNLFVDYNYFLQKTNEILNNRIPVHSDILELKSGIIIERDYIPIIQDGDYKGHIWYYHNTTEKNNFEKRIQTQKKLYENILQAMPADIAVFNPEHADLFLNPIAIKDAALRKWVIEWLISNQEGQKDVINWEEESAYKLLFNQVIKEKKTGSIEETRVNEFGKEEYFLRHLHPVLNDNNEIAILIGYTTNITERVIAEKAILKAKAFTEEMAKAKEFFMANISHEIRTPMNGIMGLIQLLLKTKLNGKQEKLISLMNHTAEELMVVVNDILQFEKISLGKVTLENIVFDPILQITKTVNTFRHRAKEKKIFLRIQKPKDKDTINVIGDPHRLHQILTNLIANAIKFTSIGGVTIQIQTAVEKNKILLTIRVKDTGTGIPKEKLNCIFSPFVQADDTIAKQYEGTGLGLSICKNLIDLHKGSITVSSEINKGTNFEVTIPYLQISKDAIHQVSGNTNLPAINGKKILIVEDVPLNTLIAEEFLQNHGAITQCVDSGLAAVNAVEKENFDLILMDIAMSEMDGLTATRIIRGLPDKKKAQIPIIALSANASDVDKEAYRAAGMQGSISKPFSEENLINTIASICNIDTTPFPYNATILQKTGRSKAAFVEKMVSLFLLTAPSDVSRLKIAIQEKNWTLVHQIAHRMKSSFDGMGITSLKSTIREVENIAKTNPDPNRLHVLFNNIAKATEKVVEALSADFPKSTALPIE
ncbi:MAG: ATP-binding protein [Sediminibacterium sp.]|nr:response regulator [Chitinophagaceae bacterium]MCA6447642.1 response regulator [Chitinophagaceae bacterium]